MGRILSKLNSSVRLKKIGKFLRTPISKKVAVSSIAAATIGVASIVGAIEGPKWHRLYVNDSLNKASTIILMQNQKERMSIDQRKAREQIGGYLGARAIGALRNSGTY